MLDRRNTSHDHPATESARQAPTGDSHDSKGENDRVAPSHPESLSVVSESSYRCVDENASVAAERYVDKHGLDSIL